MKKNLNILLIEDESLSAFEFTSCIKSCGYFEVDYVTTSKDAKSVIKNSNINLIIMDINLGEELTGIELYKQLDTDALVIYLTAYKDEKTISEAIQTEPLGYLLKPLKEEELLALLKLAEVKIAQRVDQSSDKIKLSKEYTFDMKDATLYYKDTSIKLTGKKLQLLKLLIEGKGNFVTFKSIEEVLWKDRSPSESALRTLIYRLRNILEYDMLESKLDYGIRLKQYSE